MNGTEFARINGSYSTAYICTYQVLSQSTSGNYTSFRLYGYFYYGGGTQVSSATSGGFYLDGAYIYSANYTFNPGYHLLGTKDITVGHNNDGSYPGRYVGISASSWHMSGSTGGNIYAGKINRYPVLNSGSNFNDESNPVYNITSYNTYPIRIKLEAGGNSQLIKRDVSASTSGNYTLQLTSTERNTLRALCPNSNTLNVIETVCAMNGNTELSASYKSYTMSIVNANPTFNNFNFEDVNPTTLALTGNNQNIIQGFSNVRATIPAEQKATANKQASMVKYSFTCSDVQRDIEYSSDRLTYNDINNVKSGVFNVYAIDSRNNSTLVTKNANKTIAYTPLVKNSISVTRQNGVAEETTLTINGKINLINFGEVINSIQEAKYRYKTTDSSTWSNYTDITLTVDNNGNYSFNDLIEGDTADGFDIGNSYNIEVYIADELSRVVFTANLGSGSPNIALHKDGVSIMGKYNTTEGGILQLAGRNIFNYSTNEVSTGYKWIDNKPIYRKVIDNFTVNLSGTQQTVNHNISNFGNLTDLKSYVKYGNTTFDLLSSGYIVRVTNSQIQINLMSQGINLSSYTGYIIMEYTKTTD